MKTKISGKDGTFPKNLSGGGVHYGLHIPEYINDFAIADGGGSTLLVPLYGQSDFFGQGLNNGSKVLVASWENVRALYARDIASNSAVFVSQVNATWASA